MSIQAFIKILVGILVRLVQNEIFNSEFIINIRNNQDLQKQASLHFMETLGKSN